MEPLCTDQIIGFKQVLDSIKACKGDESTMNALVKLSQATVSQATASQESVVSKYEGRWRPVPRAVPGPEVREPDVFLSGCRTFNTVKKMKNIYIYFFFQILFLQFMNFQIHPNLELLTPNLCQRIDNSYLVCKMFENVRN